MVTYTPLGRKMINEIRIKQRNLIVIVIVLSLLFLYLITRETCSRNTQNIKSESSELEALPIIYAITPTYARPVQKAELTRLSHLFLLVPNLFWVIVEDAEMTTPLVRNLLNRAGLSERSVLLHSKTPTDFKLTNKDPNWSKPRGVEQRNNALKWIRKRMKETPGRSVVFFMDDDNTYSIELFKEMSKIEQGRVGVWPVGLVGALNVEKPIVEGNKVKGFNSMWRPERPFPVDMAGFAISGDLLENNPNAMFSYEVERGYQESEILRQLTTLDQLQPIALKRILVWHTRTESPKNTQELKLAKQGKPASDAEMII